MMHFPQSLPYAFRCLRKTSIAIVVAAAALLSESAAAQTCTPNPIADWMTSEAAADPIAAPIRPADCAVVTQTPPDFGWPDGASGYQVSLTYPDGRVKTLSAPQNWVNWDEILPPGNYSWRVRGNGVDSSQIRRFTVAPAAVPFLVPDWTSLFNRAAAKAHPRAMPDLATATTMVAQRQRGVSILLRSADNQLGRTPQPEPASGSVGTNWSDAHDECLRTSAVAAAWLITGQQRYLTDAVRRLKNLASWNPNGTTSYNVDGMDLGAREIAWTLALAYDWLWPNLDNATRSQVLATIKTRTAHMHDDLIGSRSRITTHPRNSHGAVTLTVLGALSTLVAGDLPEAQVWLRDTLPLSLNAVSPWGGEDGGSANGTTQGGWDVLDSLLPWYVLRWTVGVDVGQKAWVRNWSNFMAYFIPPGAPGGVFGDGAELVLSEEWSRFGKGTVWLSPTPIGRWYVSQPQLQMEDGSRLEVLLAPPAGFSQAPYPSGTANSILLKTIGWAALHSDLSDQNRSSIYFRSSPYGAFNHGHASQNGFVIDAGGKRLAIDSGYYDGYGTNHWQGWYRQTRAHNAVTFDGGQGQTLYEVSRRIEGGQITHTHGVDHDIIIGDATAAYGGALSKALRSLVYLRPNLVLVFDSLNSSIARQWEWNIHAVNPMSPVSDTTTMIENDGQRLCVSVLSGPPVRFVQTDRFTANPEGNRAAQWHGTFQSTEKSLGAEFVVLLNIGCTGDTAVPFRDNDGRLLLNLAGKIVSFSADETTVSSMDCFFAWAEKSHADLFAPAGGTTNNSGRYSYRHYLTTNAYLGISSVDSRLYYQGPVSAGRLLDLGTAPGWYATAGCK